MNPRNGGCTFAEDPVRDALSARILWHADLDPGTLRVEAELGRPGDVQCMDMTRLAPWLTLVPGSAGRQHAVLSDGRRRIRIDVTSGRLLPERAMRLRFRLDGLASAEAGVLPMRRLLLLHKHRRFGRMLYPRDPALGRGITLLRVHDALAAGATQREIAMALLGHHNVERDWDHSSDSLRSRIRRLAGQARAMAAGGFRRLMGGG